MELDGPDLFHLVQDRPGHPSHTLKIAVLDGSVDHDRIRGWISDAVDRLEVLRRVPRRGRMRPAQWVESSASPDDRIGHHQLPAPGDESDLVDLLSTLCGEPVALDAPPWCVHHVTGLTGGRDAVVLRIHHALADGAASARLWEELAGAGVHTSAPRLPPVKRRGPARHLVRQAAELPGLARRWGQYVQRSRTDDSGLAEPHTAPMTRYNRQRDGAERRCAFVTLPLSTVRDIAHANGARVTESFLSICGGAIRRHLTDLGEPPDAPLTTNMPFGLPERLEPYGNATTSYGVPLHSDIEDPRQRLDAIRRDVRSIRDLVDADPRLLPDSMRYPRIYQGLIAGMQAKEKRLDRPAFNFIVSSVKGPGPLTICDTPVAALRSVGPLSGRFGLNLTAWSYGDDFTVGMHAYANAGDRLDDLGSKILRELEDLRSAT